MSEVRLIKKYSNRRLFDTFLNRYTTFTELRALVLAETAFVVLDRHGADITRNILVQLVMEQEQSENAILSVAFLKLFIMSTADREGRSPASCLESSLRQWLALAA